MKLAARAIAAGQIAAQGHQPLDTHGLQGGELLTHRGFGRTDTGEMAGSVYAFSQDVTDGCKSALLC